MKIMSRREGETVRLALAGELDLATGAVLRDALTGLLADDRAPHVLLDLKEITFCDSSGVEALVQARITALEHGRTIGLANAHGITARSLQITGVLGLFTG